MANRNEVPIHLDLKGEKQTQRGLKETGDAAEKAGDKFHEMGEDAGFLAKQAAEAEEQLKQLIRTLDQTGDTDLLKDIRKQRRQVSLFSRLQKELTPEATAAGAEAGAALTKGLTMSLRGAGPAAIGAIALLAADVLPFLGAAASAAVVGGVGTGGIIGGLALAAQDSQVQATAERVGQNVMAAFTASAEPFTGPMIESLDILGQAGMRAASSMQPAFEALAPSVITLAEGVSGLVDNAMPGIVTAMERAEPIFNLLGDELPEVGDAIGDAIETISEDTDGAVLALGNILDLLQGAIRFGGEFIATLSSMYEWSVRTTASVSGALEDVFAWIPLVGLPAQRSFEVTNDRAENLLFILDAANRSSSGFASATEQMTVVTVGFGVAAEATAEALEQQRAALDDLVKTELAAIDATIGIERAIDEFSEAAAENGRSLDITTEAGRRNTEQVIQGIREVMRGAEEERKLAIQHGATAQEAEAAAKMYRDEYGAALEAAAIKAFGNTQALRDLLAELDKLDGKRFTYTLVQRGGRTIGARVPGGFIPAGVDDARAHGGPVEPHRLYRVNETGVELLATGSQGGHVFNASQTQQMLSGMSGGAMAPMKVLVELAVRPGGGELERAILNSMQATATVVGGGSISAAVNRIGGGPL